MSISRRLRFEILRRDGYTCRYCGAKAPDVALTVDHVIPVTLGGGDEPNNLVTACQPCNAGKSSVPADAALVEEVDATALLFAQAIERVNEQRRQEMTATTHLLLEFAVIWNDWKYAGTDRSVPKDDDWRTTVKRFLAAGLTLDELRVMVREAMTSPKVRDEWRMFCGKAWKEIGYRQELARQLIEDDEGPY